jgi:protein O-GlcNAc transferase
MPKNNSMSDDGGQIGYYEQAVGFHKMGELSKAKEIYETILKTEPRNADVLHLLGTIALQDKDYPKAIGLISDALAINQQMPGAFNNLGIVYKELKEYEKAMKCYQCALQLDPMFEDAVSNMGVVLLEVKKYDQALNLFNQLATKNPKRLDAYYNRGLIYLNTDKNDLAVGDCNKVLELDSSTVDAYLNRGQAYKKLGNYTAALADFSQVIKLRPTYGEAYYHRAVTYFLNNDQTLAGLDDLNKTYQLNPDFEYLLSAIFFYKKVFCEWTNLDLLIREILDKLKIGKKVITPFAFISHFDSPLEQLNITQTWINYQNNQKKGSLTLLPKVPRKEKIHLGYFSSDFSEHPVSYASAGLFRHHDKSRFKLTGFYFGQKKDAILQSMAGSFDEFYHVANFSDLEITELARKLQIDIAVDMNGCTFGSRPAIFLNQAAPIQVNYLGYPGTIGALMMDYIIADRVVIPAESQKYYIEKVAYMDCFMPHDNQLTISDKKFSKEELGLPKEGFIFCGFNNTHKITQSVWILWMNILKSVPKSVLWLSHKNESASNNLLKEAESRGVDSERIIFAPRFKDVSEHLARLQYADLFLDTYPYNAHSTAGAALWAGLPILTRVGESFASRVAASLLTTCQMSELVVKTPEEYQAMAIDLATHPEKLIRIRKDLLNCRQKNKLFDTKAYTHNLENLFFQMYERYQNGLRPENINNEPRN